MPIKSQSDVKNTKTATQKRPAENNHNPDKIAPEWRPADVVREPGLEGDAYITGKKLGKGGFAVCFAGKSQKTSEIYALKVVKSQVEQKKQLAKVSFLLSAIFQRLLNFMAVSDRVTNPRQNAPSKYRGVLSCLFIRESYLRRPRALPQWLSHGDGETSRLLKFAGSETIHDTAMWRGQVHASTGRHSSRSQDGQHLP
jgi:serine/threonine protein kinase